MQIKNIDFHLIEKKEALEDFCEQHRSVPWIAMDTEFVGEKRYHTLLCIIQVASPLGHFIIDPIKIKDLSNFLNLIESPEIIKITHAGENDYRLFYNLYSTVPAGIYDTQVAAGMITHQYPISYQNLLQKELGIRLGKSYMVSDWKKRPLSNQQLLYALNDVYYLEEIWKNQLKKLTNLGRAEWAKEEFSKWENAQFYEEDPHKEAFKNAVLIDLKPQKQLFMLRLYQWRKEEARKLNISKEMVMREKLLTLFSKNIQAGYKGMKDHRRIPGKVLDKHWKLLEKLFKEPPSAEEKELLLKIPKSGKKNTKKNLNIELLHWLIKYKCYQEEVAPGLVLRGASLKKMKNEASYFDDSFGNGWRKHLLGDDFLNWIKNPEQIEFNWNKTQIEIIQTSGKS